MSRPCALIALIAVFVFATALPAAALWEPAASPPNDPIDFLHPAGPELYCTSYLGKIYLSTDHAESWTEVGTLNHATTVHSFLLIDDWILISRDGWGGNHRIQRTGAGWTTWGPLPLQELDLVSLTPWDDGVVAVADGEITYSPDYGLTWHPYPAPDERRVMRLHRSGDVLFATTFEFGVQGWYLHRLPADGVWHDVTGPLAPLVVTAWGEHQSAIYLVRYLGGAPDDPRRARAARARRAGGRNRPLDLGRRRPGRPGAAVGHLPVAARGRRRPSLGAADRDAGAVRLGGGGRHDTGS